MVPLTGSGLGLKPELLCRANVTVLRKLGSRAQSNRANVTYSPTPGTKKRLPFGAGSGFGLKVTLVRPKTMFL
jgi:hypothetical protein